MTARTLILTATINPQRGLPGLVRTDPSTRLLDYLKAFEFYLKIPAHHLPRLVFTENSGSDVTPFREMADRLGGDREVIITSHQGLDHPAAYGRGFGEMKQIDKVIDQCPPVADLPEDSVIWKGTGRYILSNLVPLMDSMPKGAHLYCDLRNRKHRWFDMRFFACTLGTYRRILRGRYVDLREDLHGESGWSSPEDKLRRIIDRYLGEPGIVPRFLVEPCVDGVRGCDNLSYIKGKHLLFYWFRKSARRVVPQVWI
jgi:hypothetical protein